MPKLELQLLGRFRANLDGQVWDTGLRYNKLRLLIAYLAVQSRAHPPDHQGHQGCQERGQLAQLLWPGQSSSNARVSLRQALSRIRSSCGMRSPPLRIGTTHISLDPAVELHLDTDLLDTPLPPSSSAPDWLNHARATLNAYGGDFLNSIDLAPGSTIQNWIEVQRNHYRNRAIETAIALADQLGQHGERQQAIDCARRATELDYWHEGGQRCLLRQLLSAGEYTTAIQAYKALYQDLRHTLEREPQPQTTALVSHLLHSHGGVTTPEFLERRPVTALYIPVLPDPRPETLYNHYHDMRSASEVIAFRHAGFIAPESDPYGITLWFGYPHAQENALSQALRAAGEIAAEHNVTVGVECGTVLIRSHDSYPLFGNPGLTARALTMFATGPGIMLGSRAGQIVADMYDTALEEYHCPNLQPSNCYRLLDSPPLHQRHITNYPLCGRSDECVQLDEYWRRTRARHGIQGLLLTGEAGIGKSRLVRWLHEQVVTAGGYWRQTHCHPHLWNTAFHPLTELIQRKAHINDQLPWQCAYQRLSRWLNELASGDPLAIELIAELAEVMPPRDATIRKLGATERRQRIIRLFCQLVRELSRRSPLVIVLEDAQWADSASLELFEELFYLRNCNGLLLLATAREEGCPQWLRQHLPQLHIGPVDNAAGEELATAIAVHERGEPCLDREQIGRCAGVPLFIEQLVKAQLYGDPGKPDLFPSYLHDLLAMRLDQLGAARRTAQLAAALGNHFTLNELQIAAAVDAAREINPAQLQAELKELVDAAVLVTIKGKSGTLTYAFRHPLFQEVAYDSLPAEFRLYLRRAVGLTLISAPSPSPQHLAYRPSLRR